MSFAPILLTSLLVLVQSTTTAKPKPPAAKRQDAGLRTDALFKALKIKPKKRSTP